MLILEARKRQQKAANQSKAGFSLIELMVVLLVIAILMAIAVPSVTNVAQVYRITGDARSISAELNLARMRAAALGTKSRLNVNLAAGTYQVEVWTKPAGPYVLEGGVMTLSQRDSFGFGSISTPAGQQSTIAEGYPGEAGCACVYFNSRGIVTDSAGNVTPNAALYMTNGQIYTAVALSIVGQTTAYIQRGGAWGRL